MDLASFVRDIPDFPEPGVVFRDITPLLGDASAFEAAIDAIATVLAPLEISKIAGVEARGFVLAAPVAARIGAGFVPIRKRGKLPGRTVAVTYALEYGEDTVEAHEDAVEAGERVAIVDDVLATGGTAEATAHLLRRLGADVVAAAFLIEIAFLEGHERLSDITLVHRVLTF